MILSENCCSFNNSINKRNTILLKQGRDIFVLLIEL